MGGWSRPNLRASRSTNNSSEVDVSNLTRFHHVLRPSRVLLVVDGDDEEDGIYECERGEVERG